MDKVIKKIYNWAIIPTVIFAILIGVFSYLVVKEENYVELAFVLLAFLSFVGFSICLSNLIFIWKKNQAIIKVVPLFTQLKGFSECLNKIMENQNADEFDDLFLKSEDLNNSISKFGNQMLLTLGKFNFDSHQVFDNWYEYPHEVELFYQSYIELVKEMKKNLSPIPQKLKELISGRRV